MVSLVPLLDDVPADKLFHTVDGKHLKNLYELLDYLSKCSHEHFVYHVNDRKNDFATWVRDVIQDNELANSLSVERNKQHYVKKVKQRIAGIVRK